MAHIRPITDMVSCQKHREAALVQHLGFSVLAILGAVVFLAAIGVLGAQRRRRRRVEPPELDPVVESVTIWAGGYEHRILVRSHGRLREITPPQQRLEAIATPTPGPWAPPTGP